MISGWIQEHNKKPHEYEEYTIRFDKETLEQLEKLQLMCGDMHYPGEVIAAAIHFLTEKIVAETGSTRYRLTDQEKFAFGVYKESADEE